MVTLTYNGGGGVDWVGAMFGDFRFRISDTRVDALHLGGCVLHACVLLDVCVILVCVFGSVFACMYGCMYGCMRACVDARVCVCVYTVRNRLHYLSV